MSDVALVQSPLPLLPAPVGVGHAERGPRVVGGGGALLAPVGVRHRVVAVHVAEIVGAPRTLRLVVVAVGERKNALSINNELFTASY